MEGVKFKNVKVFSHYSSGTHYLLALLHANFFSEKEIDDLKPTTHHSISYSLFSMIKYSPEDCFIYIYRNKIDTFKGMYRRKKFFGLDNAESFDQFISLRYDDLYDSKEVDIDYITATGVLKINNYKPLINRKCYGHTIPEFHALHIKFWNSTKKCSPDNVLLVNYDKLINNFKIEMDNIGLFLGKSKPEYINVSRTVGYEIGG